MSRNIYEKGAVRGTFTVRAHKAGTIARFYELMEQGREKEAVALIKSGRVASRQRNIIVYSLNHGYDILVQFLLSGYTGSFGFSGISWGEIGTGQTTPTNLDTALTTPTNRATVSYAADSGFNEAQIQFFFPDNVLANQTYYEFGAFCGGTATIGSGDMFNHALFSNAYSKSAGTDTTVELDISFAAQNAAQFDQGVFS